MTFYESHRFSVCMTVLPSAQWEKEAKQVLNVFMVSFSCQSGVQSLVR